MKLNEARVLLESSAEESRRKTFIKCVPNTGRVLGVRSVVIRRLAKQIAKGDWREFMEDTSDMVYEEEMLLRGAVIGCLKERFEIVEPLLRDFVPRMGNWAVCDSTCAGLKITLENREPMLGLIRDFLCSEKEYELRFGLVMLMCYYVDDEYIDYVL